LCIPRTGVYTTRGGNMDRRGVQPDVLVEPQPDQLAKGIDAQLEKAVEALQADVVAANKARSPEAQRESLPGEATPVLLTGPAVPPPRPRTCARQPASRRRPSRHGPAAPPSWREPASSLSPPSPARPPSARLGWHAGRRGAALHSRDPRRSVCCRLE